MNTKETQIKAWLGIISALGEVIKEATEKSHLGGIPSGELYAVVMGKLTFDQYERAIKLLVQTGLVSQTNFLLSWNETPIVGVKAKKFVTIDDFV